MKKLRLLSMASICIFSASLAISANGAIGESYSPDSQGINFGGEHVTRTSQQVSATSLVSDEVLLLGSAIIGLIGITIMRKTLH
ncbi:MAG TPA: hypothetical protein DDW55_14260 [Gammaproteobacteria bacterium]|nr:hypothetical protein [Gammaproteobacteria bacterium]